MIGLRLLQHILTPSLLKWQLCQWPPPGKCWESKWIFWVTTLWNWALSYLLLSLKLEQLTGVCTIMCVFLFVFAMTTSSSFNFTKVLVYFPIFYLYALADIRYYQIYAPFHKTEHQTVVITVRFLNLLALSSFRGKGIYFHQLTMQWMNTREM